jgi:hypothetical protein
MSTPKINSAHAELIGDVNSDRMTSDEEPDMTPHLADPVGVVDSITIVMRSYLSTHHLYAARYAAEDAARREGAHSGSSVFDIGHRAYVMSAVTESIAFLEAAINEIYQDAADEHASYVGGLDQACLRLMAGLWDATDRGRMDVLAKFDLALLFAGQERFDRGSAPYQDAALLVRLRNYLVHYKPEGVSYERPHRLGAALSGKFDGSAFMRDAGNPWFPDRALGAGCANWSWRSARAFTDAFASRMGLTLNYQQANFGDPLPR